MNCNDAEKYFLERISELENMCNDGTPWVFLAAAAVIDYLSKMVEGEDKGGSGYKDFINNFMGKVRPEYLSFTYNDGNQDLPVQIYHVFRCGIVHSFSFIPDNRAILKGGRDRSIVISHKKAGLNHLAKHTSVKAPDACTFVAEDFVEDLANTIKEIFVQASTNSGLKSNIEKWLTAHPPIMGL